jgi:hypothetical protein
LNKTILQIAKWVWIVVVFVAAGLYLRNNYLGVLEQLQKFSARSLLISVGFIVLGKMSLVELSRRSIHSSVWKPTCPEMFYVNSITQLAKYLPGGVWHFVGRFGIYRSNGLSVSQSSRAMLVENIWLVVSAFGLGTALVFPHVGKVLPPIQDINAWLPSWPLAVLLIFLLWYVGLIVLERFRILEGGVNWRWVLGTHGIQVLAWLLLGLSFWVIIPDAMSIRSLGLAIGVFTFGWAVGYITVFAPGGLGAREAVLIALLTTNGVTDSAIVYAAVHRLIWVGGELILGLIAGISQRFGWIDAPLGAGFESANKPQVGSDRTSREGENP